MSSRAPIATVEVAEVIRLPRVLLELPEWYGVRDGERVVAFGEAGESVDGVVRVVADVPQLELCGALHANTKRIAIHKLHRVEAPRRAS